MLDTIPEFVAEKSLVIESHLQLIASVARLGDAVRIVKFELQVQSFLRILNELPDKPELIFRFDEWIQEHYVEGDAWQLDLVKNHCTILNQGVVPWDMI